MFAIRSALELGQMRFSIATGSALLGNCGTDDIRRFVYLGTVVNDAIKLLQYAKRMSLWNVCAQSSIEGLEYDHVVHCEGCSHAAAARSCIRDPEECCQRKSGEKNERVDVRTRGSS